MGFGETKQVPAVSLNLEFLDDFSSLYIHFYT